MFFLYALKASEKRRRRRRRRQYPRQFRFFLDFLKLKGTF
jgi:hypothetical protein